MATKLKYDKFAVVLLLLVVLASSLIFVSENPYFFFEGQTNSGTIGQVTLYVLPHDEGASNSEQGGVDKET